MTGLHNAAGTLGAAEALDSCPSPADDVVAKDRDRDTSGEIVPDFAVEREDPQALREKRKRFR